MSVPVRLARYAPQPVNREWKSDLIAQRLPLRPRAAERVGETGAIRAR